MRRTLQKSMQESSKVSDIQQLTKEIMEIADSSNFAAERIEEISNTVSSAVLRLTKDAAQISDTMDQNNEGIVEISGAASEFATVLHGINYEIENCDRISDKLRECLMEFRKTEEKKTDS